MCIRDRDVLAEPWHSAIGILTLGGSALPLWLWARIGRGGRIPVARSIPAAAGAIRLVVVQPFTGLAFLLACAGIIALPPQPLDVARPLSAPPLPDHLAAFTAQPGVLTAQEQNYFTRYGGGAARAAYGPYGCLLYTSRCV